jgi:cytochrome oxidase Cu insertion factor (SCO1/SenC/PrrC family)
VPDNPDSPAEGRDPAAEVPAQAEDAAEPAEAPEPAEDAAESAEVPKSAEDAAEVPEQGTDAPGQAAPPRRAGRVPRLLRAFAQADARVIAGIGALGVILVGAAPMAAASVNRNADTIVARSIAGDNGLLDSPAPSFTLTSQDGRQVSLASLRGKVVLLTFLDPVCTTDCPLIAQEMRSANTMLGGNASNTELVAVVANPTYRSTAYTKAFTSQENLGQLPNWLFLTGSLSQLTAVWHDYGIEVEDLPAGAMAAHNDLAFVIDSGGRMKQEISIDPGPGTAATKSSFAGLLADSVMQTMGKS